MGGRQKKMKWDSNWYSNWYSNWDSFLGGLFLRGVIFFWLGCFLFGAIFS